MIKLGTKRKIYYKSLYSGIWLLYLLVSINSKAQNTIGHPDYYVYSNVDYINANQIFHVEENSLGLIYIANVAGIQEYDGENWKIIGGEGAGSIRSFAIDERTGIIYFGKPGELGYLRPNKYGDWEYKSISKECGRKCGKFSEVWNVRLINDDVYFQTYLKLFRYNITKKEIKVWEAETFFSLTGVIDSQLYIGQSEKGLFKIENDSLVLLSDDVELKGMLFYNIVPVNDTHILITSPNHAVFVNKTTYKQDPEMDKYLKKLEPILMGNVYYFTNLSNNKYGVTTFYNGIYILDSLFNIESNYNKEDGLPTNIIWYITQSNNGILWAGMDNGVLKINTEKHLIFFDKNKNLNNRLSSLSSINSSLYLGTNEGLFKLDIGDIEKIYLEETNIRAPVWNMLKYENQQKDTVILVASTEGVWEQKGESYKLIVKQTGVGDLILSKMFPNRIYYSYNRGVSYIENLNGKWLHPVEVSDLKMGYKLLEDVTGNLWVYTGMQGAYLISHSSLESGNFQTQEIIIDTSGVSISDGFLLNDTAIVVTTKGFYKFNQECFCYRLDSLLFNLKDKELLPSAIFKVSDNEFWVAAYNNDAAYLFHYNNENGKFKKDDRHTLFFKYRYINKIYSESTDRIWLSLSGKLLLIKDLDSYREDTSKINVLIRNVSINNDSVIYFGTNYLETKDGYIMNLAPNVKANSTINYNYNNISFEFSAPFFNKEFYNEYSFKLDGYEEDWSEWSTESKKGYTNLREGDYTFIVKARNIYDIESEPYSYSFTISPPYYRSLLAHIIYLFVLITSIAYSVWRFRNKHKIEKTKLESIITQRTSEIRLQKEKIENQAKLLGNVNQQLHKLSIVASKVDNPVIICDIKGKIEWVNDSYCKYFDKNQEEMIRSNFNLIDICFNSNVAKFFDTCIKEKRAITYTINASKVRINKELWMQTTLTPIVNSLNEVTNIIAISSDITYLHELNNTRDMVISVITHDLKSPLLAFKMIAGNLLRQLKRIEYEKLERNLNELYLHSSEIYEFLQYLSEWLKSQSGSLTFFPHIFDISKILNEVLGLFRMSAMHKKITLKNEIPELTEVFADEHMLKTVFRNLISNAVKFSKIGDEITISMEKEGDKVVISVSDNGIGIPNEKRDKLFSINENKGLGLIICKEFVQKNKGEIWIEDKEKGALIKFTVPVR